MGDIDTAVVDRLKALDPEWPIREADLFQADRLVRVVPILLQKSLMAFANGDSLALKRFAVEVKDDGAAQS